MKLIIENVRTFVQRHEVPIAPLTVITGENSSGKSTLLGIIGAVFDPEGFPFRPGFNHAPYSLGPYDTIASYKGGKFGRSKSFTIGFTDGVQSGIGPKSSVATYEQRDGQPSLKELVVEGDEGSLTLSLVASGRTKYEASLSFRLSGERKPRVFAATIPSSFTVGRAFGPMDLLVRFVFGEGQTLDLDPQTLQAVARIASVFAPGKSRSIAPIRTKPERVYGETAEGFEPTGDHVPFVLDRMLRAEDETDTQAVLEALRAFGDESGMFAGVKVRKLGSNLGDPFQLMVRIGGRWRNLIDVGYGVSQALPVVVQAALASPNEVMLVQQPEVHLHPRAQAALGTLLATLVEKKGKRFVVETHSDYILDRLRGAIASKQLTRQRLGVLFCERADLETVVWPLGIEEDGRFRAVPTAYRAFFLDEQRKLLSMSEE